jgi:hypothetical protein
MWRRGIKICVITEFLSMEDMTGMTSGKGMHEGLQTALDAFWKGHKKLCTKQS